MRLTRILLEYRKYHNKGRRPQNPNKVPFDAILPMKLKNRVSGKTDSQNNDVPCLLEMSVLFAAMKDHEFNSDFCRKEIDALNKANIEAMNAAREKKLKNAGVISTTGRDLNSKQLNKYLKKFPNDL